MSDAKAGTMVSGNVAGQIFLFTLPIMAGNFLQQLYNTVDGIIVGRFVGEGALASIGTCAPLTILYIALAVGLSTGSSIIVAQYFGAGKMDDLRSAVSTSLILLTLIGIAFSIVGGFVATPLLKTVLAVPEAQLSDAAAYFSIYCVGLVFQFVYNIVAAILRALGDSKATLYFLLISSVLNIILDILFIAVFQMGVPGAALATIISQAVSAVASVIYMIAQYPILRFNRKTFLFDREKCVLALKMGIPTTLQQCVISGGHIAVQRLVNSFGVAFMSGFTAGSRLESYLVIPAIGFNVGLSTFTGQNIGAKNLDRVKKGLHKTLLMSAGSCIILSGIAVIFARPLVALFGVSGDTLTMGIDYLRLVAPFFVIFGVYQAVCGVLQGSGDVMFTMFCTLSSLLIRCVLSYGMAYFTSFGYRSICYALPMGWVYVLILVIVRYRAGKWKKKGIA